MTLGKPNKSCEKVPNVVRSCRKSYERSLRHGNDRVSLSGGSAAKDVEQALALRHGVCLALRNRRWNEIGAGLPAKLRHDRL